MQQGLCVYRAASTRSIDNQSVIGDNGASLRADWRYELVRGTSYLYLSRTARRQARNTVLVHSTSYLYLVHCSTRSTEHRAQSTTHRMDNRGMIYGYYGLWVMGYEWHAAYASCQRSDAMSIMFLMASQTHSENHTQSSTGWADRQVV